MLGVKFLINDNIDGWIWITADWDFLFCFRFPFQTENNYKLNCSLPFKMRFNNKLLAASTAAFFFTLATTITSIYKSKRVRRWKVCPINQ